MPKYITRQRRVLLEYLERHTDEQLWAKRIADELADEGVSLSAVYRNLSELEAQGKLHRCSKPGSRETYYRYTGDKACRECLHLSCKKCGKTFHMDSSDAELLIRSVDRNEEFKIDRAETVLYGVCKGCQK